MRRLVIPAFAVALAACGGASSEPAASTSLSPREGSGDEVASEPIRPPVRQGTIARAELDGILAQGFGAFLSRVGTEPHLDEGRFVGFRFTELRGSWFEGVDLQAGDTLVSVNGMPIERPEEALQVWNGLRVASELTVEYLRDAERHQLRFAIED